MEFRLLGPIEVVEDGRAIPLGGPLQRALLALLLLRANEAVSVERLIDDLWGADPPAAAGNTIQQYVSQLRKLLGPERILTRAPGYQLRVSPGELDVERVEMLLRTGSDGVHEALALWRGPALADFADEPFAQLEIRRLEELRLAATERRIDVDLGRAQSAELVGELETLVAQSPFREHLRCQLMLALYRSGRQAEALAAYRAAREALVDGLGIEPGQALQELERAILRHDPSLAPRSSEPPERPERPILVVSAATSSLPHLLALAEPLAQRPDRELLVAVLLPSGSDPGAATAVLAEHRDELAQRGRSVRVVAYVSANTGEDAATLATEQDAGLVLLDAPGSLLEDGVLGREHAEVLSRAPCDVGLVVGAKEPGRGPVLVPFGGDPHDWSAIELAAWLARNLGVALRLAGARGDTARGDAGRLLGRASLAVQAAVGVVAEPTLVDAGAEGMAEAAHDAAVLVVGISEAWQDEGIGAARLALARTSGIPTVFVRRGDRPGGLAPPHTITRFSWTLAGR
jgi:DNA-binding SARP family transcriptional activator